MDTLIKGGIVVNEQQRFAANIVIHDDTIAMIKPISESIQEDYDNIIDATDCFILPGIIDSHVHFREPGMEHKATIASESAAAVAGGVTTFFEMPNTKPATVSVEALDDKRHRAAKDSLANYAFYAGATNDNIDFLTNLPEHDVPAVKLFMGSSTGNMLVDHIDALDRLFAEVKLPIMAHCEDTPTINKNLDDMRKLLATDDPAVCFHPQIRSREACLKSTRTAVQLADRNGARLHVAHISTKEELDLFRNNLRITAEAVIAHLLFCDKDYASRGTMIKCNPAVKTALDRDELRKALSDGRIYTVATDHAPHLLVEKQGGSVRAASGMPMVQFSLIAMLSLVDKEFLTLERLVELMCHNPSRLFEVQKRGFLRPNYKADIAIVKRLEPWRLRRSDVLSLCGWSPLEGMEFGWRVKKTIVNGHIVYNEGSVCTQFRGQAVRFR